ncbi:hypothetical protein A4F89_01840 [Polynucleobacter asymbioticus]|jgi:hypothetical protein|uniref:Uncharacterized protein n=2 Tax=Polynucleobacter asymbioticus TaxID=576611 RepID=A0AAC9NI75_9BURK|nr:hypothetical protein A4F89_01840 [Polynucleobacter asymbioticus]APC00449.1 hypothetical protein AOC25_01845 [Polynucleobacter asymbioticus]
MVVNADSLVMIDFARDFLLGKSIAAWNLPRAPYLFPDTVIALLVMSFGWFNSITFLTIATINFCLLIFLANRIINRSAIFSKTPLWQICTLITLSLFLVGAVFPFSIDHLYWQVFASGAHFLTSIVAIFIFDLARPQADGGLESSTRKAWLLAIALTFAEALSDSMAALLIFAWYGATLFSDERKGFKKITQYIVFPIAVCISTALSFLIPRQSLVDSFFSYERFVQGVELCLQWAQSSYANMAFIALLILASIAFPFLVRNRFLPNFKEVRRGVFGNYTLPSLGIICATPLFYQDIGSLRYLAFPGLLLLLSCASLMLKCVHKVSSWRYQGPALILGVFVIISAPILLILHTHRVEARLPKESDLATLIDRAPAANNPALAMQCIDQAAQQYPLADGVATYWNARPTYFFSQFKYFLAQASPWHPRSGYLYWGNNGLDFSYADGNHERPRHYNYILATNDEIQLRLWGSLVDRASAKIHCAKHTVLFFANEATVQNYLFPFGRPFDIDAAGHVFKPNAQNQEWIADPYWGTDLFTAVGVRDNLHIRADGKEGVLVYGPYISLPAGSYRLIAKGSLTGDGREIGVMDISARRGAEKIALVNIVASSAKPGIIAELPFLLEHPVIDAEFRVFIKPNTTGVFTNYELIKLQD